MKFANTIIIAAGLLLVVLHAFLCTKGLVRTKTLHRLYIKCAAIGRSALLGVKRYLMQLRKSDETTAVDELMRRKLEHRKAEIAHYSFVSVANLMTLGILMLLVSVSSGNPMYSDVQALCFVCALALSICAYSAPPSTPMLPEIHYACMMIISVIYFLWSPPGLFMFSQRASFFVRFVLSVALLNVPHMVLWNLTCLGANVVYYSTTNTSLVSSVVLTFYFDLIATLCFIVVSILFKQWMSSEIEREIQISSLKSSNSSSKILLDMMCDVFLELSDKLNIARESPRFAALMFKSTGSVVQGQPFASFIEDDLGRQTFESQLIGCSPQNGNVGVCNTTLRDGLHNRINVEVFYVKVELDTDIYHYLLGIRESNQETCNNGVELLRPEPETRTRAPAEQIGTPPIYSRSELTQTPVRYRRKVKGGLHNPHLKKTESNARCKSMETCLASWNIHVPRSVCCSYHAYVIAAKKTLTHYLARDACRNNFARFITDGFQCQTCGIIIDDGQGDEIETCPTCDSLEIRPFCGEDLDNGDSGTSVEVSDDDRSHHLLNL